MNITKDYLISNYDWGRFNQFYMKNTPVKDYWESKSLPINVDEMFPNNVFYAVVFEHNANSSVGHWVLLLKHSENDYEYFNCLGSPNGLPMYIKNLFSGRQVSCSFLKEGLMDKKEILCGKYCMFRLNLLPMNISQFKAFCTRIKPILGTVDAFVDTTISFPLLK